MYDIIKFKDGSKYIVVGFESNEDMGSCSYDRAYYLIPYQKENEVVIKKTKFGIEGAIKVNVKGTTKLPFKETSKRRYQIISTEIIHRSDGYKTEITKLKRVKKKEG